MDEENKMYITKEVVKNKEHSEIDFLLQKEFGFDYDIHNELVEIRVGNADVIKQPINVDMLIKSLQDLKDKGTTHVSIDYHCDHIGYEMTGYKIYHSTEEQIRDYEEKLKKKLDKEKKLKSLLEEIRRIQNE